MTREDSLKLEVGDFVIATNCPENNSFTNGKVYEIGGEYHKDNYPIYVGNTISVKEDDRRIENGWSPDYFTVAPPAIRILYGVKVQECERHD